MVAPGIISQRTFPNPRSIWENGIGVQNTFSLLLGDPSMPRKSSLATSVAPQRTLTAQDSQPTLTEEQGSFSKPPSYDRASGGRFARGNPGGPGNPNARHCAHMLDLLRTCIKDEEVVQ